MAMALDKKYVGDGGNEQRIFMKCARIGWKAVVVDPNKHLPHGVTLYDHLE